ncbi:MAG: Fic family protein [Candidatus Bathyarchaeota archaeon]|nr:Fic family protein [Candidatus Bathyarchaeota archaeon]
MVWYPEVEDVVCVNIEVLDLTNDRHPHKLLGSRRGIQTIIDKVKNKEESGLTWQAAILMKELARLHLFAGANHRTAYVVAKMFLIRNGRRLRVDSFEDAYPFIKNVEGRNVDEIKRWVEHGA